VLRAQQSDLEDSRSDIVESLTRLQYQLATAEETIKGARTSVEQRNAEFKAEEQSLADLRKGVQTTKTENEQLLARLQTLRDQFQNAYHSNRELLGKKK
jgi:chromosome segregation ATPase